MQALDVIVRQLSEGPFAKQYYKWLHCEDHEYTLEGWMEQVVIFVFCEWVFVAGDKNSNGGLIVRKNNNKLDGREDDVWKTFRSQKCL